VDPDGADVNMNTNGKDDSAMEPRGKQRSTKVVPQAQAPLIHNLEELRSCVLRRLESIEALARRWSGVPAAEIARLEQALEQRIDELELERSRSRAGGDGGESSGEHLLAQLENDRQLLTEAWERLERERIDTIGSGAGARPGLQAHHPRPAEGLATHAPPAPRPTAPAETGNPVTESILRQFQTLCSDVRRTTDARCSPP
jgi:hypothetical protein